MTDIRIFLVRHGLSEANMDKAVNARKPDHAVSLAGDGSGNEHTDGHVQAILAGRTLALHLGSEYNAAVYHQKRRLRLLVSPYDRTRQTAAGLRKSLDRAGIAYDVREVMELREISFGLYDGLEDEELAERFPAEHAHYQKHVEFSGELFAPMPMGESRIQVGDRVKSVFGTILRDAQADEGREPVLDFVVVSHGVTIRQFRQRWMHRPWEWAEAEPNPANCSITLIEGRSGQGYVESGVFAGFRHIRGHERQESREDGHALPRN